MAFVGEIRIFPYVIPGSSVPRAPEGWLLCDGRTCNSLAYPDLALLFSVIGIRFGGKDASNFLIPDLRGRLPVQVGRASGADANGCVDWTFAQTMGVTAVTLAVPQLPQHTHKFGVFSGPFGAGSHGTPVAGDYVRRPLTAAGGAVQAYSTSEPAQPAPILNMAITTAGGAGVPPSAEPHNNCQPSLTMNFFICWAGQFPKPDVP